MRTELEAVQARLVEALSGMTTEDVHDLVMDPWIELRRDLNAMPLAA